MTGENTQPVGNVEACRFVLVRKAGAAWPLTKNLMSGRASVLTVWPLDAELMRTSGLAGVGSNTKPSLTKLVPWPSVPAVQAFMLAPVTVLTSVVRLVG